jgi:hypothetical protein
MLINPRIKPAPGSSALLHEVIFKITRRRTFCEIGSVTQLGL